MNTITKVLAGIDDPKEMGPFLEEILTPKEPKEALPKNTASACAKSRAVQRTAKTRMPLP